MYDPNSIPTIDALSDHQQQRPVWSVMIPAYNCAHLLRSTLESVLAQDQGPARMQIEVVDDSSTKDNPAEVVASVGKGRVDFFRQPKNQGVTRNFNTCLRRSRGHFVHILHGDDLVDPTFYSSLEELSKANPSSMFLAARCSIVDEFGEIDQLNPRSHSLEVVSNDASPFFYDNPFRTPAVVVKRAFYEQHGGFYEELCHTADWEMWVRAISLGGGIVLNQPLAQYRWFAANDTSSLMRTAENLRDRLRLADVFAARYPNFDPVCFRNATAKLAREQAERFKSMGDCGAGEANSAMYEALAPLEIKSATFDLPVSPRSSNRDVTVISAADDAYAMPLAVMVRSALETLDASRNLRVYVLDGGLSDDSKRHLLDSWDAKRVRAEWIQPAAEQVADLDVSRHVSIATYFRLLIPDLVPPSVTRAIYLDADLLIRRDLGQLWDEDLAGASCLAAPDTAAPYIDARIGLPNYRRCHRYLAATEPVPNYRELGLTATAGYFNAGVMLVDLLKWRVDNLSRRLLACLRQQRQHAKFWDQYALNVELAGNWRALDPRWNQGTHAYTFPTCQESPFDQTTFDKLRSDPWIVHFTSDNKPWNYFCRHPFRERFFQLLDQTAWRGFRPTMPENRLLSHWWRHRFAPVRHWFKVCQTRVSHWVAPIRTAAS